MLRKLTIIGVVTFTVYVVKVFSSQTDFLPYLSGRMAAKSQDKEMNELKKKVLIDRVDYLSGELGDPGRYLPALRAKGVLSLEDCEKIKAKVTSREKVTKISSITLDEPIVRVIIIMSLGEVYIH